MAGEKKTYVSVKIDAETYRVIRTVAAWKGLNVADYLSQIARGPADKDFAKMQREKADSPPDP
jgi:hypothetical protein